VIYRFGKFQVDDEDFRLSAEGSTVPVEPKALRVLLYLIQNRSRLVRKGEILDSVWQEANVTESVLTRSIGLLRKALNDDSREPRFIETVPTAGYRFVAEVSELEAKAVPAQVVVPEPEEPVVLPRGLLTTGVLAGGLALLLGCLVLVVLMGWRARGSSRAAGPIRSLAVLPLQNLSGDPSQEYFADGMTDELITELASIPNLRVVSRTSVMQDKGSHKSLRQIAEELKVDAIVEGSIVRSGNRVRITAQLIDARSDRHLWAKSFEGQTSDVLSLQDSVARNIAAQARVVLAPTTSRRGDPPIRPAAHDAYLRGRYFFGNNDFRRSAEYFQQAIDLDSNYASAYAGLADALDAQTTVGLARVEDAMPRALAAAKHAIKLDPENGEAYTALGSIQTIYGWDWAEAEKNLTRGIALSPSYSLAEMKYAVYLDATGRPTEAVSHMRRALDLDPLSFFMTRRLGATLYLARDYDGALQQLRRASEMEPSRRGVVDNWMSDAYIEKQMPGEAVDHDLAALGDGWPKLDVARLHSIYQRHGWEAYWRARIEMLQPDQDEDCVSYETGVDDVLLKDSDKVLLRDRDEAFANLNRAVDQRCYEIVWLRTDPLLDPVRGDTRFSSLLRRVNLAAP
jgi:TolB-like protein/DNA-binding winged helix-turn-helix (wHTH) protein/Tfp pilus assembly protein PilF